MPFRQLILSSVRSISGLERFVNGNVRCLQASCSNSETWKQHCYIVRSKYSGTGNVFLPNCCQSELSLTDVVHTRQRLQHFMDEKWHAPGDSARTAGGICVASSNCLLPTSLPHLP